MTATETEIQRTFKPQWCNDCTLLTLTDKTPTVADDIELGGRMKCEATFYPQQLSSPSTETQFSLSGKVPTTKALRHHRALSKRFTENKEEVCSVLTTDITDFLAEVKCLEDVSGSFIK